MPAMERESNIKNRKRGTVILLILLGVLLVFYFKNNFSGRVFKREEAVEKGTATMFIKDFYDTKNSIAGNPPENDNIIKKPFILKVKKENGKITPAIPLKIDDKIIKNAAFSASEKEGWLKASGLFTLNGQNGKKIYCEGVMRKNSNSLFLYLCRYLHNEDNKLIN